MANNDTGPSFRSSELDSSDAERGLLVKITGHSAFSYRMHGKKRKFVESMGILITKIVRQ